MESKVSIEGLAALQKKLAALPGKIAKDAIRKGTRAGAKIVQSHLKATTPRQTGAAVRNIKVRAIKRSRKYVGTTVRFDKPKDAKILYIAVQNYGSKKRGISPRRFINAGTKAISDAALNAAVSIISGEIVKNANRP